MPGKESLRIMRLEKSGLQSPGRKDATLFLAVLFTSLEFGQHFDITISGIKVTVFDIVVLSILTATVLRILAHQKRVVGLTPNQTWVLVLLYLFMVVETGNLVQDVDFPRNVTLVIAVIRMLILLLLVSQLSYDQSRLIDWIVDVGCLFSLVAIAMYFFFALPQYYMILSTPGLWHPDMIYSLGAAGVLRLTGLWQDPNFFFIINIGPFVGGLYRCIFTEKSMWVTKTLIIFIAMFLTFSRSGFLLLTLFGAVSSIRFRRHLLRLFFSRRGIVLFLALLLLVFLGNIVLINTMGRNLPDMALARIRVGIDRGQSELRLERWRVAWNGFQESPIFGKGGRYVLRNSGQYSHNDYLEILSSHGLVGFVLMMALYLSVFWVALHKAMHSNVWKVYFWTYTLTIGGSAFFTIFYNPVIWLWAFLALSRPLSKSAK